MNATKSLLAITLLGLTLMTSGGCSARPITDSQAHAAADDLDPANKATATDPRNKMAAHGIR
jgi:hypothetical protein